MYENWSKLFSHNIAPKFLWCAVHRMLGWSVSQCCQIAWCWRSFCVCPMTPCWELVWPVDSGWLFPEMSSFGRSCSTATIAYRVRYPDTQVDTVIHCRIKTKTLWYMLRSVLFYLCAAAVSWYWEFRRLFDCIPCVEVQTLRDHCDQVLHLAFSHRGHRFSSCSKDCTVKVGLKDGWSCFHHWSYFLPASPLIVLGTWTQAQLEGLSLFFWALCLKNKLQQVKPKGRLQHVLSAQDQSYCVISIDCEIFTQYDFFPHFALTQFFP